MTNQFTQLLLKSADEVREYQRTSLDAHTFVYEWLEFLAHRLEQASSLNDNAEAEREIDEIVYSIIDSGPLTEDFLTSFQQVLDEVQSRRKRL